MAEADILIPPELQGDQSGGGRHAVRDDHPTVDQADITIPPELTGVPPPPPPGPWYGFLSRPWNYISREIAHPTPATADSVPVGPHAVAEGVVRGMSDVLEAPTRWGLKAGTATGLVSQDRADEINKGIQERRDQYEKDYGDSTGASVGRFAGQTLATAPALGGAGRLVTAAAERLVPQLAPVVGYLGGAGRASQDAGLLTRIGVRAPSLVSQGATQGAATGALTAAPGQEGERALEGAGYGAGLGLLGGVVGPLLERPIGNVTGWTQGLVERTRAALADKARGYGIDIDPAQLTTNPQYKMMGDAASRLPLSGVDPMKGRLQWQNAVATTFGEDAPGGLTPEIMGQGAKRITGVMDDITNRTTVHPGANGELYGDLGKIGRDMDVYGLTDAEKAPIAKQVSNVIDAFRDGNGTISGKAYQTLTQTDGPVASLLNHPDPRVQQFGGRLNQALSDAFDRSVSKADSDAWNLARQQYRNLKTVQPLIERSGGTPFGINPERLESSAIAQSRRFDPSTGGYAYGDGGPLGDLARIGRNFFPHIPESGTAPRALTYGAVMKAIPALAGTAAGLAYAPLATALTPPSAVTVLGLNRLLQSYLHSPTVGRRMVQQSLSPVTPPARGMAPGMSVPIIRGLLGQ